VICNYVGVIQKEMRPVSSEALALPEPDLTVCRFGSITLLPNHDGNPQRLVSDLCMALQSDPRIVHVQRPRLSDEVVERGMFYAASTDNVDQEAILRGVHYHSIKLSAPSFLTSEFQRRTNRNALGERFTALRTTPLHGTG
jgi:hypothetical protein